MKNLYLFILCLFPLTAMAQQPTAAQAADNRIGLTAQHVPQQTPFAAAFDTRFEISHTPGYVVELDKESLPEGFELTAEKQEKLSPGTVAYDLTFIPFTLGVSTFTAVTFNLKKQAGAQTLASALSEQVQIDVKPVKYFDEQTLRDIRPPYIPSSLLIWLLCLLVLGLIIYFAWYFYKEIQTRARELSHAQDNRPADEIALSKIEALLQSGLWERAQYKMFYIELGDILREYFWRRFKQDVSSDTSAELLRRARKIPQLKNLLLPLREYLNSSDLVKFAKVIPAQQTMQQDVGCVRKLVKETTPRPEQAQEEVR